MYDFVTGQPKNELGVAEKWWIQTYFAQPLDTVSGAGKSTGLIYNVWGVVLVGRMVCVSIMRPLEYNSYRHKLPTGEVRPTHAPPKQYTRRHWSGMIVLCVTQDCIVFRSPVHGVLQQSLRRRWFVYTLSPRRFLSPSSHPFYTLSAQYFCITSVFLYIYLLSISMQNIHSISTHYLLSISCPHRPSRGGAE